MNGKKLPEGVAYLNNIANVSKAKVIGDPTSLENIGHAFDCVAANLVSEAGQAFIRYLKDENNEEAALENVALLRYKAARAHCQGLLFKRFKDAISSAPSELSRVLTDLCKLYGLYTIHKHAGPFLQYGYYRPEHISTLQSSVFT